VVAASSGVAVVVERESVAAKHVNTCSCHVGAATRVDLRVIINCYIDRGHLGELNGVKNIVLSGLEVAIINVQVFAHQPCIVYYVLHMR
jgi:hypothetical protein